MRKTLLVLGTVAIPFAVMFCVVSVAQATGNEPGTERSAVPGLEMELLGPDEISPNERVNYTIRIRNVGNEDIEHLRLTIRRSDQNDSYTNFRLLRPGDMRTVALQVQTNEWFEYIDVVILATASHEQDLYGEVRRRIQVAQERTGVSPPARATQLAQNRGANATPLLHTHSRQEPTFAAYPMPSENWIAAQYVLRQLVPNARIEPNWQIGSDQTALAHGLFLVLANQAEHGIIKELLEQFNAARDEIDWSAIAEDKLVLRVYAPTNPQEARIRGIHSLVEGLLANTPEAQPILYIREGRLDGGRTYIMESVFMVYGRKADHEKVRNLLAQILQAQDEAVAANAASRGQVFKRIPLTYVDATQVFLHVHETVPNFFREGASITVDFETNSLGIRATADQFATIEAIITQLDVPNVSAVPSASENIPVRTQPPGGRLMPTSQ